jgi:hypothetical protein
MLFLLILQTALGQQKPVVVNKSENLAVDGGVVPDKTDLNNNFYDNEPVYKLPMTDLYVEGEVENPGKVDFSKLPLRTVIVKEALLTGDTANRFIGAYRYDGYSLFDILNDKILKKSNATEFKPIIDVYVTIENNKGEKVVLSWGEIYYPNYLHNSIIASRVMRIVPSKTKDLWPLPAESKLVVVSDLITERNISSPVRITVHSYKRKYEINRELSPLVSEKFDLFQGEKWIESISSMPKEFQHQTLHTIFYGKGRGIHSTQPFSGIYLKEYLGSRTTIDGAALKQGLVVIAGIDGYRSVYTLSEIVNRNDQAEILIVPCPEEKDGGKFRIFPSCDFFSDRAVKALSEIRIDRLNE